ncbi:copia protein [Caerostris extrusa]|uniref:Copia protein n=1 Tax=Caerostris extrusa TaxID=172846 RepID=A0AAV4WRN6_CAEEX|nr:copia protein [Caerostris extrusa]
MDPTGTKRFPLLNQTNWSTWKENIRFLLMNRGCWSFIDGSEPKLEETSTRRERSEYKQRQDQAFSTIYYGVDDQHKTLLSSLKDAAEAWKLLQEQFEPKSRASVIRLLDEFFQIKFDVKKDTIAIFIARICKHVKRLMDAGHPFEDMYPTFQSIRTLPPDFQGIVQILYRWPDKNFKLDKIEMELIAEVNRIRQLKTDMNSTDTFIVNNKINKFSDNSRVYDCKNKTKFTKSKFKNEIGPCYMCKKMGNLKRNCKYLNSNSLKLKLPLMDVYGPLPVESRGGAKYFLSITDDFLRMVICFPLKEKSQVFECFKTFQANAERVLNRKIISVRCDDVNEPLTSYDYDDNSNDSNRPEKTTISDDLDKSVPDTSASNLKPCSSIPFTETLFDVKMEIRCLLYRAKEQKNDIAVFGKTQRGIDIVVSLL